MVASTEVNELERLLISILRRDAESGQSPYLAYKGMIQVSTQVLDTKAASIRLTEAHEWQPAIPLVTNVHLLMTPARHGTLIIKNDRGSNVRLRPFDLALLITACPPDDRPTGEKRFADVIAAAKALAEH